MENAIFEVLTKVGLLLAGIIALVWWLNAGMPFVTINRRH